MIGIERLSKSFGPRTLFADATFQLNAGSRYGVVGANGSGKTTFLRILAGDDVATDGAVIIGKERRVGVLRQDRFMDDAETIVRVAMRGDDVAWKALADEQELLEQETPDPNELAALQEHLQACEAYSLRSRASTVLEGLGIPTKQHDMPLGTLSGGFKLRVQLAQVLIGRPDLLLLDEPTNHLDILTIRWLEKFLGEFAGCVVVISHDHRFLDNVSSHILDVDYETITAYVGNYQAFLAQKALIKEQKEQEAARVEKEIAEKRAFVERFRAKATKARQAQSRAKQVEKLEAQLEKPPETSRRAPALRFEPARPSGRDVLTIDDLSKAYGDKAVLKDVSLSVRRSERVAIIGANGLGKSTLLRIAVGRLEADAGDATWGHEARVGYFPQNHTESLTDDAISVLDETWSICPQEGTSFVRGKLGQVLFSGDDVHKKIGQLSGGEAARVLLCKLMIERPNVLVLDEPTNHLDLESIEALVAALKKYDGTVLFVSHDRWFVSELATRVVELREDGYQDYPGTYGDYLAHCGDDHLDADVVLKKSKERAAEDALDAPKAEEDWKAQKKRRNRIKELSTRRDKLAAEIETAEARQAEIQKSYCEEGFFERTSAEEVASLQAEESSLDARVLELMESWEAVETELTELENAQ